MTDPADGTPELSELLDRLLGREQDELPTSMVGRFGRLAGSLARTGAVLGWRRLRTGAALLDEGLAFELVRSFGTLKGVAMKAGQILSYTDESLPPEARRILATLQTHSPQLPFPQIARTVEDELGERAAGLLACMDPQPVASASIGQVHRATLPDGSAVAVKVQYPRIEEALAAEFRAAGAGVRFARVLMPAGDVESYVAEARDRILAECDYVQELRWQRRFRAIFRGHPVLRVPDVHPEFSSRRVLTSEWVEGKRFDAWLEGRPPQEARNRIGVALYEFYLGSLLRHGLFNADPHPGNYLLQDDDTIAMLDYGCVREFSTEQVRAFVSLGDATRRDEPNSIRAALRDVGAAAPLDSAAFDRTRALLRAFFSPTLVDQRQPIAPLSQSGVSEILSDKRTLAELRLPGEFLFLFRIRFGLHAVLARLGAEANWHRLESDWAPEQA
jgi:predicted unusual protein kinase regulating ubiquinone biosynthesis (AarF/ABC1/UbiB family)